MPTLCERYGAKRGRPIELRPRHMPTPGPSGLWIETDRRDVIIYQSETTRLHQDHIILHELGHMIVADDAGEDEDLEEVVETWAELIPVFEPEMVRRVSQRCSYESEEECAVEAAATSLLEWSSVQGATPMSNDPSLRRVQAALGDQRGWR